MEEYRVSAGHLLSVLVEELGIEKPNLSSFISKINNEIEMAGNGYSETLIHDMHQTFKCGGKTYWGFINYINSLEINWGEKERIMRRLADEAEGVKFEDRLEEFNKEDMKYY